MKKRNMAVRLGVVALVLTLVTTSLTSGTLAKYTTLKEATGTATVAAFGFNAYNANLGDVGTRTWTGTFDLVSNSYKPGTTAIAGSSDSERAEFLAPGAKGVIPIMVDTTGSEVAVNVSIKLFGLSGNLPDNMQFGASQNSNPSGVTFSAISEISDFMNTGMNVLAETRVDPGALTAKTYYIHWIWPYEAPAGVTGSAAISNYHAKDTSYGMQSAADRISEVIIEVKGVQVDPTL